MDLGPILRYELIRTARWRRHYALRTAIGLTLVYAVWVLYSQWDWHAVRGQGRPIRPGDARALPGFAELCFLELAWVQGLAILLVVPGLVAGSIAEEDRGGTMVGLLASPLSSGAIVLGKLGARLVQVGVVLGVGLPLVVPMALLGLLDGLIVATAAGLLLALALFVGSLSLLVSTFVHRPRQAILLSYILVGVWLLLPGWYAAIVGQLGWSWAWLQTLNEGILQSHPYEAATYLFQIALARFYNLPTLTWDRAGLTRTVPRVLGYQAAFSALFLLVAVGCLRPFRLGRWSGRGLRRAAPARSRPRPAVSDQPMLWKERYASGRLSWKTVFLIVALSTGLFVPLAAPAWDSFREWRQSWHQGTTLWARGYLNRSLRQLDSGLYVLGLAVVAATAATSVTGERERGTWTSLATTLVTGREVARAKVAGAVWAARGLSIPFLGLWVLGLVTGSVHPLGVLATAAGLLIFARYAAALGVLFSMVSTTSERALSTTFMALLASNSLAFLFVPLDLLGPLAGTWQTVYLAGLSPLVEWVALTSPMEISWWLDGRAWEEGLQLPWRLWSARIALGSGLIRTYLASMILHVIATAASLRAAAWSFESQRAGQGFPSPFRRVRRRDSPGRDHPAHGLN